MQLPASTETPLISMYTRMGDRVTIFACIKPQTLEEKLILIHYFTHSWPGLRSSSDSLCGSKAMQLTSAHSAQGKTYTIQMLLKMHLFIKELSVT